MGIFWSSRPKKKKKHVRHSNARSMIAITVPHAYCESGDRTDASPCDSNALAFATDLAKVLPYRRRLFVSSQPRRRVDLNRKEGRYSGFRPELERFPFDILIDCHSFPDDGHSFATDDTPRPQVALLYLPEHVEFVRSLFEIIRIRFDTTMIRGSYRNDIMTSFIDRPSVLIEVSESMSKLERSRLAEAVVYALNRVL